MALGDGPVDNEMPRIPGGMRVPAWSSHVIVPGTGTWPAATQSRGTEGSLGGVARRDDRRRLDHQDHDRLRRSGAVHDALRDRHALMAPELDRLLAFDVDHAPSR